MEIKYYKEKAHLLEWYYAVPVGSDECVKLYINKYNDAHITSANYYGHNEHMVEIDQSEFNAAFSKCLHTIIKEIRPKASASMINDLITKL